MIFVSVLILSAFSRGVSGYTIPRENALMEVWYLDGTYEGQKGLPTNWKVSPSNSHFATGPFPNRLSVQRDDTGDIIELQGNRNDFVDKHSDRFTLSFFIYLTSNIYSNNTNEGIGLFDLGNSANKYFFAYILGSGDILEIGWRDRNNRKTVSQVPLSIPQGGSWFFFAFTSNRYSITAYSYDLSLHTAPTVIFSQHTGDRSEIVDAADQDYVLGGVRRRGGETPQKLNSDNRMACIMLYNEQLTFMEIRQLPTVCASKGTQELSASEDIRYNTLQFFSPLAATNESTTGDYAYYLPKLGIADGTTDNIVYPCPSSQCSVATGSMSVYDFPTINTTSSKVLGAYQPFQSTSLENTWTVAFYVRNNNNQAPSSNGNMFTLSETSAFIVDFNSSTLLFKVQQSQGSNTVEITSLDLFDESFVAITRNANGTLSIGIGDAKDFSNSFEMSFTTSDFSGYFHFSDASLLKLGGNPSTPMEPNELGCFFVFSSILSTGEVKQLPTFCRNWVSGSVVTTTTSPAPVTSTDSCQCTDSFDTSRAIPSQVPQSTSESLLSSIPEVGFSSTSPLLINKIMEKCHDFDPDLAVPPNRNKTTILDVGFEAMTLHGFDTVNEFVSVGGLLMVHWRVDTCPIESETIFSSRNFQELFVPSIDQVWIPKLKFMSSESSNIFMKGDNVGSELIAHLTNDGSNFIIDFWYMIYGKFDSKCEMKKALSKFPMDTQNCTLSFELGMPTQLMSARSETFKYIWNVGEDNGEWDILSEKLQSRIVRKLSAGRMVETLEFDVVGSRVWNYYVTYLAVPVFILGIVEIATFLIPTHDADRAMLSITILLALYFAQSEVLSHLPIIKNSVLLGSYVVQMAIFSASVAVAQLLCIFIATTFKSSRKLCANRVKFVRIFDLFCLLLAIAAFVLIHALVLLQI